METLFPRGTPSGAILVVHSWWGLTDSFRAYGAALAKAGYVVGLADLFAGRTAQTETQARKLRAMSRRVPMYKILDADIRSLRATTERGDIKVGIAGF